MKVDHPTPSSTKRLGAIGIAAAAIALPPMVGVQWSSHSVTDYLEFPPRNLFLEHAPFSVVAFAGLSLILSTLLYVLLILLKKSPTSLLKVSGESQRSFPVWGWMSVAGLLCSWVIAWTRLPTFAVLQLHTFLPLWLSFIVLVNALCFRKCGTCPFTKHGKMYSMLFAVSASFWWMFEFLNRFVQNWSYENTALFSPSEYFLLATLSFSTVLPAVHGTKSLADSYSLFARFRYFPELPQTKSSFYIISSVVVSLVSLFLLPLFFNELYPFIWLAPFFILAASLRYSGVANYLDKLSDGDWSGAVAWAMSALFCGLFWEMWNFWSFARWIYHVPFVDTFRVFEMPALGFAGYLPFGLVCGLVVEALFPEERFIIGSNKLISEGNQKVITAETADLSSQRKPQHVAIIMDGNGRWATGRGLNRSDGHRAGLRAVKRIVEAAQLHHVRYLTLFAFSSENWHRPKEEVALLMSLLEEYLRGELDMLIANNVRLRSMGDISQLPESLRTALRLAEYRTRRGTSIDLIIALSYGGRNEIVSACRQIANAVEDGLIQAGSIDEQLFSKHLYVSDLPDPDLIIRTGNEFRVSNFMLWQLAYSELVIQPVCWPEYTENDFVAALQEYSGRERRFGRIPQSSVHCKNGSAEVRA